MAKRRAGTELNRDNWDQEEEPEEVGEFVKASEDVLKKRVIKTAKRRVASISNADGGTKSLFSGFSGFATNSSANKQFSFLSNAKVSDITDDGDVKKPSFSFLSNAKGSETSKDSGDAPSKPAFSLLSKTPTSNGTDVTVTNKTPSFNFSAKITNHDGGASKSSFPTNDHSPAIKLTKSPSQDKLHELSKQLKKNNENPSTTSVSGDTDEKSPDDVFVQKLQSLNLLCVEWIIKHLNENLSYILTPVFDDYKKYLDQLKEERRSSSNTTSNKLPKIEKPEPIPTPPTTSSASVSTPFKAPDFKESLSKINFGSGFFAKPFAKPEVESNQMKFGNNDKKDTFESSKNFSFESEDTKTHKSPMFTFGTANQNKSEQKIENKTESDPPKFSFGLASTGPDSQFKTPFFNANFAPANTQNSNSTADDEDNDEQPPVKEDVNISEEGSVYDKKCKVFIKKDGNFVDHGVGFLFLKLVGDDKKCQLIVRANNKLANIIINVLLSSSIPLEKKGKNNVMVVCCPTPDAKPSVVLLKVKTEEDADQLLEMMNKHKK